MSGSTAPIDIDNDNGSVVLTDMSGPLQVSTDNWSEADAHLSSPTVTADADNGNATPSSSPLTTVVATTDNGLNYCLVVSTTARPTASEVTDQQRQPHRGPAHRPTSARTITIHTDNGSATARTAR